jgi:hypothetical protein
MDSDVRGELRDLPLRSRAEVHQPEIPVTLVAAEQHYGVSIGTKGHCAGSAVQDQREERGTATFSAEMTMETADFANPDSKGDPAKLGPHTHHIKVTDGVIHNDATDPINWKTQCPTFKPAVSSGFVVTGTAYVTGNGGNPPFGNPSPVTICVLGGTQNPNVIGAQAFVEFSNFTLTFGMGSRASSHFGTQAINGVVAECERPWNRGPSDCKVAIVD